METRVAYRGSSGVEVSELVLGHNLEALDTTIAGLMADRLANPKFLGPANPLTGIAPGWHPSPKNNEAGVRFELTSGLSLSGNEAQLIHVYDPTKEAGILQIKRVAHRGERLRVRLWARAQHYPAQMVVGLRQLGYRRAPWVAHEFTVDATYWKEYSFVLQLPEHAPEAGAEAVFYCHVRGAGMVWLDQVHLTPDGQVFNEPLLEQIRDFRVPVLRFPGGCVSANYRWRYGTGPLDLRPVLTDPVFKWHMAYDFGTDEYLQMCLDYGIKPQITVNVGTGTPEEAGEWAAYCRAWYERRGLEPPEIYWQIGNEHWGDWEVGNMTPEMYADALCAYVPEVRANYPKARIIALGPEKAKPPHKPDPVPWGEVVIDRAADMFDVLAVHYYQPAFGGTDQYLKELAGVSNTAAALRRIAGKMRERGLDKRLAVTEWNLWMRAAHHDEAGFFEPYTTRHIMFAAGMLNAFVRLSPDLELANFYHLINAMGVFRVEGGRIVRTAMADLFALYRDALPGVRADLDAVNVPRLQGSELPAVDLVALERDGAVIAFAVNRDWERAAQVSFESFGAVQGIDVLHGESLSDEPALRTAQAAGNSISLPPLSVARIRFATRG